jgi:hypothetical protein
MTVLPVREHGQGSGRKEMRGNVFRLRSPFVFLHSVLINVLMFRSNVL